MKDNEFIERYYQKNLQMTKKRIRESVSYDNLINQCVSNIDDLDRAANLLSKRLREWYGLINPEFTKRIGDHDAFVRLILTNKDDKEKASMGADIPKKDMEPILNLARMIDNLYSLRKKHETYLDSVMRDTCPNVSAITGSLIGARLISHAGTLKRLSVMTASTIQILGAEKALFRHMKTGAKAPKHGLILQHQLLQKAKAKDRGKVARALADKIAIAAKVDYFKGDFVADRLKKELEKKVQDFK